jgi:hypothetical protein
LRNLKFEFVLLVKFRQLKRTLELVGVGKTIYIYIYIYGEIDK